MTVFAIALGKNISSKIKLQLINLAAADLLLAGLYIPYVSYIYYDKQYLRTSWECRIYLPLALAGLHASPIFSAVISLERLFIIFYPLKAKLYTRAHKIVVIICVWLFAAIPEIVKSGYREIAIDSRSGVPKCRISPGWNYIAGIWLSVMRYVIPVVTVVVSYTFIFIKLRRRKKSQIVQRSTEQTSDATNKMDVRLLFYRLHCWSKKSASKSPAAAEAPRNTNKALDK
ncbi:allatostatin-A receptor-like [Watersipora subatra]|uniref:allatostatin-A receptor-like n=1 Tax=Watersipora subatra TaxID=2589382 RepID=UPI00355C4991